MRVLVWQELFWPCIGGIEVLSTKLFATLRQRGWEFVVVTRQDSPDLPTEGNYQGIRIYRYPFPWSAFASGNIDQLLQIRQQITGLIREFRPDLVHLNSFGPSFFFYHNIPHLHRGPLMVTLHTTPQSVIPMASLISEGLFQKTLRRANWVTCVSRAVLDQARQLAPQITSHASVIYNGFDAPTVLPEPLSFDPPYLLCLGRLVPEKGFDLAIAAVACLLDRFPRLRLVIVGDGPARYSLEQQVTHGSLTRSVEFVGWVPPEQVSKLLNRATAVLMPSHREGLPSVAIEAALMARPIVAARVGGLPEVVVHERTGLLVGEKDPDALAHAIIFLLRNPQAAETFGAAARARAQELFSFDRYVNSYEDLYRKMINEIPSLGSASSPL